MAGICVGLQLLFGASDEGGEGLGLLAGPVRRLRARRVPHMGWNTLACPRASTLLDGLDGADVYFAHSFAAEPTDPDVATATVEHDGTIVAAVESGAARRRAVPPGAERPGRRPRPRQPRAMVKKRVIPCLDVAGGRVVKGVNFENLREMGEPVELAAPLLRARRRRARLPRHHGDPRGPWPDRSS